MAILSEIVLRGPEKLQGQAPKVREVCADFEDPLLPMNCQRKDIPDEGPGDGGGGGGAVGLEELVVE